MRYTTPGRDWKLDDQGMRPDLNREIANLARRLSDDAMKSSMRLLIIISLYLNDRLSFSDLLDLTGLGKGSLANHLNKLTEKGLIRSGFAFSLKGPITVYSLTEEGKKVYTDYVDAIIKMKGGKN